MTKIVIYTLNEPWDKMYRVLGEMSKDEHAWYLVQFLTDKGI